jgi:hypothetical protein
MLFEFLGRIQHRPGFEQSDPNALFSQHLSGSSAASSGADNDDFWLFSSSFGLCHELSLGNEVSVSRRRLLWKLPSSRDFFWAASTSSHSAEILTLS